METENLLPHSQGSVTDANLCQINPVYILPLHFFTYILNLILSAQIFNAIPSLKTFQ